MVPLGTELKQQEARNLTIRAAPDKQAEGGRQLLLYESQALATHPEVSTTGLPPQW